jgi:hypothetical protein
MSESRRLRILRDLVDSDGAVSAPRLCGVSESILAVSGAGIMLVVDDGLAGSLCTTDEISAAIEDLQYTLGEGPCVDAYDLDEPVLEPDLAAPSAPRWPAFTPAALESGARAIFGFPVRTGAARLGALNVYNDQCGPLTDQQHQDALIIAELLAETILALQSGMPEGQIAIALEQGANFRYVVHQAAGMISVQLDVTVSDALVRLRAHAFASQRPLTEVAADVVARRLRFEHR